MTDPCGCCDPSAPLTPIRVENRPGLSAIAYRAGTYASFLESMLHAISHAPQLASLTTRRSDDFAITLMALWAAVADVLTFYQERYANEAFLGTADLRESVGRLTRLIGYDLRPGAAALAQLAFTIEEGKTLRIPVGLPVQSVPGQDEQPQTFETLEAITAEARWNRHQALPPPFGVNPLAKGNSAAFLAAGEEGLAIARALAPDDRILVFNPGTTKPVEELTVREIRVQQGHALLSWTRSVESETWSPAWHVSKFARTFRLFGHNAPSSYMHPSSTVPGEIRWVLKEEGAGRDYSYGLRGSTTMLLDSLYKNIQVGSRLLVSESDGKKTPVTVEQVDQAVGTLGPLSDTVTRLTVSPAFPDIDDRRQVLVYELAEPPIHFWGYDYPSALTGASIYLPARRIDDESVEIGRTIVGLSYQDGVEVSLKEIETGHKLLISDGQRPPVAATVTGAAIVGRNVSIGPTAADTTTAAELGFGPPKAKMVHGLLSALLPLSLALTDSAPQLSVTIGDVGPRKVSLGSAITTPTAAAGSLQARLNAADSSPAFAQARVIAVDRSHLLVLPGTTNAKVHFAATDADKTTAAELGLTPERSKIARGLLSDALGSSLSLTNPAPEVSVTLGVTGPRTVILGWQPPTPSLAAILLWLRLTNADPAPAFAKVRVILVDDRLLVLAEGVQAEVQEYLRLDLRPRNALNFDAHSAALSGNIALSSHGETVIEVVGSGDASKTFQRMTLKKKRLTFVSRAGSQGVTSTLQLRVNGVQWKEVASLYGQPPTDQVYTTRTAEDGTAIVEFGDRSLPSGQGNVKATYRFGLGLAGRVRAQTLTTAMSRPAGFLSVTNPLPAEGGADPETTKMARRNAPQTVRTFARAVSLRDFEDLVTDSGEVAKAQATWVWDGMDRVIHITVTGQAEGTFTAEGLRRLAASLRAARDPNYRLRVHNYVQVPVRLRAIVRVDPAYVAEDVIAGARAAALDALSFETFGLGQPIHVSDLYRVLHDVPGVVSVDVEELQLKRPVDREDPLRGTTRLLDGSPDPVQGHLRIFSARPDTRNPGHVLPAELAWIESPTQDVVIGRTETQ